MPWYKAICHNEGCLNFEVELEIEKDPDVMIVCGPCGGKEITDVSPLNKQV